MYKSTIFRYSVKANACDMHTRLFDASTCMAHTQMHLVYPLDLPNSSNHTELLTFSCVRSTVRSESWQPLDCSLTHTVVVSTATFFYTSPVPRPLVPLVGLLV